MAEPFPWAAAMHFGLGTLRLAPRDFWAMTPRELAAAIGESPDLRLPRPNRAWLDAQARLWPDGVAKQPSGGETGDEGIR